MYKMDDRLTFLNIVEKVLELYPEYKATEYYKHHDQGLQYSFFGGFTTYVVEKIKTASDPMNSPEIKGYFDLFNNMLASGDEKLSELAVIEVIEDLVQEKSSKHVAAALLNEAGKKDMTEVLKYTGVSD
jgi:hypothetical protein